jgi:hypothetical protein
MTGQNLVRYVATRFTRSKVKKELYWFSGANRVFRSISPFHPRPYVEPYCREGFEVWDLRLVTFHRAAKNGDM